MRDELPYSNYPPGVDDDDPYFNGEGSIQSKRERVKPPLTTMVYCPPCMKHWKAPARADYWNARVELCPEHQNEKERL